MDASRRWFSGPMGVLTWLVALGWLALAAGSFVGLAAPGGTVLGVVGLAGALATGWLAVSMRVPCDAEGIVLPRVGRVPWSAIDAVEVHPGLVSVPVVSVRRGRALDEVPLDGLAWFGGPAGVARTLAERVARQAGIDDVGVRTERSARGRRALT